MLRLAAIGLVWMVGVAVSGAATAACSCQCIEGVARTLCSSIDEARDNPTSCVGAAGVVTCPRAEPTDAAPVLYDGPAGAAHCRAAQLWDADSGRYAVAAKICELDPGEATG